MDQRTLESKFEEQMHGIYASARQIDYNPARFLQMLNERGGLATARALINADQISEGFTILWQKKRLDLTIEALVLREPWRELFTPNELAVAESRLRDVGYIQGQAKA